MQQQTGDVPQSKGGKRKKNKGEPQLEDVPETKQAKRERIAKQLEEEGGEVNEIDSQELPLDGEEIVDACALIDLLITDKQATPDMLLK